MKGLFIVFEGADGTGKTTQAKRLSSLLNTLHPTVYTREPGGTPFSERLRDVLLLTDEAIPPLTEILTQFAARHHHLETYINPLRDEHKWVICDRFVDSSYLYQVMTQGIPYYIYDTLCDWVVGEYSQPDLILVLDVPNHIRAERLAARTDEQNRHDGIDLERMDAMGDYLRRQAQEKPHKYLLVDGQGEEVEVFERVLKALSSRIELPYDLHSTS